MAGQADLAAGELPLYIYYRHSATPNATQSGKFRKEFQSCRKSLSAKDLRLAGRAAPALTPYGERTYGGNHLYTGRQSTVKLSLVITVAGFTYIACFTLIIPGV